MRRGAADRRPRTRQEPERGWTVLSLGSTNLPSRRWSGCGLEAGVNVRGDQLDLLGRESLAGDLQGWAEGAGGKDGDAVDQQLAQPGQSGDMDTQDRVDVQVRAEAEGLGDLGGLPPNVSRVRSRGRRPCHRRPAQ